MCASVVFRCKLHFISKHNFLQLHSCFHYLHKLFELLILVLAILRQKFFIQTQRVLLAIEKPLGCENFYWAQIYAFYSRSILPHISCYYIQGLCENKIYIYFSSAYDILEWVKMITITKLLNYIYVCVFTWYHWNQLFAYKNERRWLGLPLLCCGYSYMHELSFLAK